MDRCNNLEKYNVKEDFWLRFRFRKDLAIDKGRLAAFTKVASS